MNIWRVNVDRFVWDAIVKQTRNFTEDASFATMVAGDLIYESTELKPDGTKRNQTLWTAFVLNTSSMQLFIGGDGGYDTHFAEIGKTFGPMDLAILENGQYNRHWRYIHTLPDEIANVYNDLNALRLLTVHHAKFALSNHPWYEPLEKISSVSKKLNIPLITPMIGEQVNLKDNSQRFSEWWKVERDR